MTKTVSMDGALLRQKPIKLKEKDIHMRQNKVKPGLILALKKGYELLEQP